MRICKLCSEEKPLDEFPLSAVKSPDGNDKYRRHICKRCYVAKKKVHKQEVRAWFVEYRKTLSCNHCGNSDHRVLEFHHRDPSEKDAAISDMVGRAMSKENILLEVSKCDVLCANCHRIVHYKE